MILKPGKEYYIISISCCVLCSLLLYVIDPSSSIFKISPSTVFLMIGVVLVCVLVGQRNKKKSEHLHVEISKIRTIMCEGPASYNLIGGWLFLSEDAIEFYAYNGGANIPILLDDIVDVKIKRDIKGDKLILKTNTEEYKFSVFKIKLWEKFIKDVL